MNLLQKFFRTPAHATPAVPAPPPKAADPSGDAPSTILEGSENAIRRQLVHVLLRDLLRKHGIPAHWIELQMLVVSSSRRGDGLHLRLVVKHWDQRLMDYALALQNELKTDVVRFDPLASHWVHGISWQLEMADSCPYTTLPDKSFWLEPVKQAAPMAPAVAIAVAAVPVVQAMAAAPTTEENDALEDLDSLFFIRDQEIAKSAGEHAPVGYESTQPSPL
jgi:hypothetical protein